MKTFLEIVKYLIQGVNLCIGILAIVILFGEEAPEAHLSIIELIGYKTGAGLTLYVLYREFLFLGKHNFLPKCMLNDYEELIIPDSDANRA